MSDGQFDSNSPLRENYNLEAQGSSEWWKCSSRNVNRRELDCQDFYKSTGTASGKWSKWFIWKKVKIARDKLYRMANYKSLHRQGGLAPRSAHRTSWGWSRSQRLGIRPLKCGARAGFRTSLKAFGPLSRALEIWRKLSLSEEDQDGHTLGVPVVLLSINWVAMCGQSKLLAI